MLGSFVDVLENIQLMTDAAKAAVSAISAVPAAVENVARLNAISPVIKSTQMIAEVLSDMRRSQQEVMAAVRPTAIAASMQKDVVSEVAKSLRIPQTMRDSIATAAKMSRLMNISGIVKALHGFGGENSEDHIEASSDENLEDKGNKTEDNDLENNRD